MAKSLLFRILIIIFGYTIQYQQDGLISGCTFFISATLYFVLFLITRYRDMSIVRLLVDFSFINLIIYKRDVTNPLCFLLVLLPMINAVNYSGKNSRSLLLMVLISGTFILHMEKWDWWVVFLPIVSLWFIFWVAQMMRDLQYGVKEHIDTYFTNQVEIAKPHVIYQHIIKDLNRHLFLSQNKGIRRISAYNLKGNTLWLINASTFLWERRVFLTKEDVELLRKGTFLTKKGDDFINTFMLIKQSEVDYVFCCEIDKNLWFIAQACDIEKILYNTYSKIKLLLNADYRIQNMRNEKFDEIKDNVLYVNKAIKIMHFIRNRMTPIKNLLEYQLKSASMSQDIRRKMDDRMRREIRQADSDLSEILSTADYLLDKSNNPFEKSERKEHHYSKIYIITSEITQRLLDGVVEPDETIINLMRENTDIVVSTNLIETKIMLVDWINNIRKYKKNYYSISISHKNNNLIIHMENDYDFDDDTIGRLVKDINSRSKDAVIEGKDWGYGIHIIRSIAFDLKVDIKSSLSYKDNIGNILVLDLIYKTHGRTDNINI